MKLNSAIGLAVMGWALFGCQPQTQSENTSEAEPAEAVVEEAEVTTAEEVGVLNPNFATKDELSGVSPELTAEAIDALVAARPFLSVSSFISTLNEQIGVEAAAEILPRLFLPLNLNDASEEEVLSVPGVGSKMAHEFEEYRPYRSIEQFRREIGKYVSDEEVAAYEQYVFVPVELNTGTKEQILSIPGVGDRMLHEFEEYRPYQSMEQFRREIGKYVDDDELARLERYVTLEQ